MKVWIDFIDKAIDDLFTTIWVREYIDIKAILEKWKSWTDNLCKFIANNLWLDLNFQIEYVDDIFFRTKQMSTQGESLVWLKAQIELPSNIENLSWNNVTWTIIKVKILKEKNDNVLSLATILVHELSHIILYLNKSNQKENEYYTDLTGMMLWFKELFKIGRKSIKYTQIRSILETQTKKTVITYGYLNDEEFEFACTKISNILSGYYEIENQLTIIKKKLSDNINLSKRHLISLEKILIVVPKNIAENDFLKIKDYYDINFIDKYKIFLHKEEKIVWKMEKLLEHKKIGITKELIKDIKDNIIRWMELEKEIKKNIYDIKKAKNEIIVSSKKNILFKIFKKIF